MSLRIEAARGLKWQAIEIGGRQLLSLAVFTTLARLLDPSAFGLIGLVGVYLAFVGMFVDQGIGMALIQRRELEHGHLNAAFWFNIVCAIGLCLGTMFSAGAVAAFLREPRLVPLLRVASLALVVNAAAAVHTAVFVREMDFRRPAVRTLLASVVGGAVGIVMAIAGGGVWALVAQQLAGGLAGCFFLWAASSWRPSGPPSFRFLRELLSVSGSVFGTDFLWFFSSRIDQVVIGRFAGTGALGQYVVGRKLSEFARVSLHQPLGTVSMPALSRLQDDHDRMCRAIYKGMELNALASFAVFGGLAAIAPVLVPLAFGEQWRPAVPLLQLASVYSLVLGLFVYCNPALLASGGPGKYLAVSAICAAGAAVACFIGIRLGVYTVLAGLTVNIAVIGVLALLFLRQRIGLQPSRYFAPCLVPAVAALAMFVVVSAGDRWLGDSVPRWLELIGELIAGAVTYTALVILLAADSLARLLQTGVHALIGDTEPAKG